MTAASETESAQRVHAYAHAVVDGYIPSALPLRRACERHLRDLERGHERGLRFDDVLAARAIDFFPRFLRLSTGAAVVPFWLEHWQAFQIGSLFGWLREDGFRRFRTVYDEVARKNGKTPLLAGCAIYANFIEGELSAQGYAAATKRDQAALMFKEAVKMVELSPPLRRRLKIAKGSISDARTFSFLEPLPADAKTADGFNVHFGGVDEVHAHKNRLLIDLIRTATASRRQPIVMEITTAGFDRETICFEHHEYSMHVLDGRAQDDSWLAFIYTTDEGDDWRDEGVWPKANPNLGVSVQTQTLRDLCAEALLSPGLENSFRRLHLNQWTEQDERAIALHIWDEASAPFAEESMAGRECFGGLDLSQTGDFTALGWTFPPQVANAPWRSIWRFWIPEAKIVEAERKGELMLRNWARAGLITPVPGDVIDHGYIKAQVLKDCTKFKVREIAYDPWSALQISTELFQEGVPMVAFRQGMASMAAPTSEFLKMVARRQLHHGGNPVARWMAGNLALETDAAGNNKPAKNKSKKGKIDGMVAIIMAIGRASQVQKKPAVIQQVCVAL